MSDFPWRKHSKKEILDEFYKMKDKLEEIYSISFPLSYSRIGYKCSNNFFQYERMKTSSFGNISCYDFWKENKNKIIKYNKSMRKSRKNSHDLLATTIFMKHAPAQFPTFIAAQVYKYFNVKKILDPFAGWGDRCFASIVLDIDYIGIETNINLNPFYDEMINFYPTKSKTKMIYKKCENVDINKLDFDFVFSSPPYWNDKLKLLENYYNCEKDYDLFLHNSLIPFIKKCMNINPDIWICLNIPPMMYNDIKKYVGKCKKKINFKTGSNNKSKNHSKYILNNIYCF